MEVNLLYSTSNLHIHCHTNHKIPQLWLISIYLLLTLTSLAVTHQLTWILSWHWHHRSTCVLLCNQNQELQHSWGPGEWVNIVKHLETCFEHSTCWWTQARVGSCLDACMCVRPLPARNTAHYTCNSKSLVCWSSTVNTHQVTLHTHRCQRMPFHLQVTCKKSNLMQR